MTDTKVKCLDTMESDSRRWEGIDRAHVERFRLMYSTLVNNMFQKDNGLCSAPQRSQNDPSSKVAEKGVSLFLSYNYWVKGFRKSYAELGNRGKFMCLLYLTGWGPPCTNRCVLENVNVLTNNESKFENDNLLLRALICRICLDHDFLINNYTKRKDDGGKVRVLFDSSKLEWTSIQTSLCKIDRNEKNKNGFLGFPFKETQVRRHTMWFCISTMLDVIDLGGIIQPTECGYDIAACIGGLSTRRENLTENGDTARFEHTEEIARRLGVSVEFGMFRRNQVSRGRAILKLKKQDALLWTKKALLGTEKPRLKDSLGDPAAMIKELKGHGTRKPKNGNDKPDAKEKPKATYKCTSFTLKGRAPNGGIIDPIDVSRGQAELHHYTNEVVNQEFHDKLRVVFEGKQSIILSSSEFGSNPVLGEPVVLPIHSVDPTDHETETASSTRVWCITDIFSEDFQEDIMEYLNKAAFLTSSDQVGSKGSRTNRYYRCAQEGGGFFQMKSDPTVIGCADPHPVEKKLLSLVSELAEHQDQIINKHMPVGKYQYRWDRKRVMCQVTASSLTGSRYGEHNDCGWHHNHEIETISELSSPEEIMAFLSLPHRRLMRVWTFVFSNRKGANGALCFLKDMGGGKKSGTLQQKLVTNHCCLHIQSFGVQSDYEHLVQEYGCTTVAPVDMGESPGRWVISIRESVPATEMDLAKAVFLLSGKSDVSKLLTTRSDYFSVGVADAIRWNTKAVLAGVTVGGGVVANGKDKEEEMAGRDLESLIKAYIQKRLINRDDIFLESDNWKVDRTGPPIDICKGWVEDPKSLIDRILSSYFVSMFYENHICLWVKRRKTDNEQKSQNGEGKQKETKDDNAIFARYGFLPKSSVASNWNLVYGTSMLERDIVYDHRHCRPGDILVADHIRTTFSLPENSAKGELWNQTDSRLTNCVILRHHYKNDEKLDEVQNCLNTGVDQRTIFWIGGSGGSAQFVGSRPMSLTRAFNDRPPPVAVAHNDMRFDNPLNRCMLECISREQPLFVFAPPLGNVSNTVVDSSDVRIDRMDYLQFIGIYTVCKHEYARDTKETIKRVVESACSKYATNFEQEFWNHSYRCSQHFKFYLEPLEIDWDLVCERHSVPGSQIDLIIDTESPLARDKLYYTLEKSSSMYDEMVGCDTKERLWKMFETRWLPDMVNSDRLQKTSGPCKERGGITSLDKVGKVSTDEDRASDEQDQVPTDEDQASDEQDQVPYIEIDDTVFSDGNEDSDVAVASVGNCPQQHEMESTRISSIMGRGLEFTFEEMFSMLTRISAAGASRALGGSYNKETESYTYLSTDKDSILQNSVGDVMRGAPLPMPVRTYDVATAFFLELVMGSCRSVFGREDGYDGLSYIMRRERSSVSEKVIGDIILTSLIVRTTGNVRHLRKYLTLHKRGVSSKWKRLFDSGDAIDLPLFLRACQLKRGGKSCKRQKTTTRNIMTRMVSDQFRKSVPNAVKTSVDTFDQFLKGVNGVISASLSRSIVEDEGLSRKDAILSVKRAIRVSSSMKECNRSIEFVASQVICDLEEIFCGNHESNGASNCPFLGDYRVMGYGGTEGYAALGKLLKINGNPPSGVGVSRERWAMYLSRIKLISEKARELMGQFSEEQCMSLGLSKITEQVEIERGEDNETPKITKVKFLVLASNRELSDADIEHFMCKLYLLLHRYRGTRAYSLPSPLRAFCHPIPNDEDIFCNNPCFKRIMRAIVEMFELTVTSGSISEMKHPFVTCDSF